ncbi:MAG: hypothetical protein R3Y50_04060 [Rikenellaceae bacterium]
MKLSNHLMNLGIAGIILSVSFSCQKQRVNIPHEVTVEKLEYAEISGFDTIKYSLKSRCKFIVGITNTTQIFGMSQYKTYIDCIDNESGEVVDSCLVTVIPNADFSFISFPDFNFTHTIDQVIEYEYNLGYPYKKYEYEEDGKMLKRLGSIRKVFGEYINSLAYNFDDKDILENIVIEFNCEEIPINTILGYLEISFIGLEALKIEENMTMYSMNS